MCDNKSALEPYMGWHTQGRFSNGRQRRSLAGDHTQQGSHEAGLPMSLIDMQCLSELRMLALKYATCSSCRTNLRARQGQKSQRLSRPWILTPWLRSGTELEILAISHHLISQGGHAILCTLSIGYISFSLLREQTKEQVQGYKVPRVQTELTALNLLLLASLVYSRQKGLHLPMWPYSANHAGQCLDSNLHPAPVRCALELLQEEMGWLLGTRYFADLQALNSHSQLMYNWSTCI